MDQESVELMESESRPSLAQRLGRLGPFLQLIISIAIVSCVLFWLVVFPHSKSETAADPAAQKAPAVEAVGPYVLSVERDSPLGRRLTIDTVEPITVTDPILHVTGSVIASRRPGKNGDPDFWQFDSVDLLQAYSSREKALADEQFATSQLQQIQELAETKATSLKNAIGRLQKLVQAGTESERDLVTKQTELMETEIQNRKDVYQAEVAVKAAHRDLLTLGLRLRQSGLDPDTLHNAGSDLDIISAEIPEAFLDRVALGQTCDATFFGLPKETFHGKISVLSPVLSTEQRTLRVLIDLADPNDRLRPGMFASIGVGTDARKVLRISANGVVHLGRKDYVFREEGPTAKSAEASARTLLRAIQVDVGESINGHVEILAGLSAGDQIVDNHSILLKPVLQTSLAMHADKQAAPKQSAQTAPRVVGERLSWGK